MSLALALIILALLLGGIGLAAEAFRWVLIVALIFLIVGVVTRSAP